VAWPPIIGDMQLCALAVRSHSGLSGYAGPGVPMPLRRRLFFAHSAPSLPQPSRHVCRVALEFFKPCKHTILSPRLTSTTWHSRLRKLTQTSRHQLRLQMHTHSAALPQHQHRKLHGRTCFSAMCLLVAQAASEASCSCNQAALELWQPPHHQHSTHWKTAVPLTA
jgi:hypothetical protein